MRLFGFELVRSKQRAAISDGDVEASYDAAQTNVENQQHWAAADSLSPNAAADRRARDILVKRSRYEVKNNSFAKGIVLTLANDTIGRGPRLQMLGGQKDIERDWSIWCRETKFCEKLRTMRIAKCQDGEAIARFVSNYRLSNGMTLDLRLYEAEELADPTFIGYHVEYYFEHVDGIELDSNGNPLRYHLLRQHPGGQFYGLAGQPWVGDWWSRDKVIHLYREDRPGQRRGIPELTPALPLFAMLRRYSLSTLAAAETAADLAAVLKTEHSSYDVSDIQNVDPGVSFPIRRRTIMSLPFGWEVQQLKAEQPTTTFKEFRDAILNEIARCLNVPFNVAAANSAGYNYASGRLDHQVYNRAIDIEREYFQNEAIEPVFDAWLREYLAVKAGILPSDVDMTRYKHRWYWDPKPHADPSKEASAVIALWDKGLKTDDDYLLSQGIDPESHYEQLKVQNERRENLGLPMPGVVKQQIETGDGSAQSANY